MKKALLTLALSGCVLATVSAQDFDYGKVSAEEMNMTRYAKDTSAHAVVLAEYGKAEIQPSNDDDIKVRFLYHVKIKIFDNEGFDAATKEIKLRNSDDNSQRDEIETIKGVTFFVGPGGGLQKADFDPSKVYVTRDYKEESTAKFTMPALAPGCVIEYTYMFVSPWGMFLHHFQPWDFQSDIPKVYSQFEALIPGHFTYNATLHGFLKLTDSKSDVVPSCFSAGGSSSSCSDLTYTMRDVPAFEAEDYITSAKNYRSGITWDLVEYTYPYDMTKHKGTTEWKDIDYNLKDSYAFGRELKKADFFKDRMVPVIAGTTDDLGKAKAIYEYMQQHYKWNNYVGIYSPDGVKKAFDTRSGSVADINIGLIDALNSVGVKTEALLISTRENGFVNDLYPAINYFNYIIAKVTIGDKTYLLDATNPELPFGMLDIECLNGKGRVFSLDKPSYWMDISAAQKQTGAIQTDLTLQDDGKLKGTVTFYSAGYEAYAEREAIKKFNSQDEYVAALAAKLPKLKILKADITNLDSLDKPVIEKYEVELNAGQAGTNSFSLSPFFLNKINTNPFKLKERSYPVDMGVTSDYRNVMIIHLPAGYTIDSPPTNTNIALPNNGGRFITDFQTADNVFTFSDVIQLTKPEYAPEEYPYLKEFFNKIILSEKAEIIIKKKS